MIVKFLINQTTFRTHIYACTATVETLPKVVLAMEPGLRAFAIKPFFLVQVM